MTDDSILDDDQSDEIFNMVVKQMTSEEAEVDQLTPGSYAKRKKLSYPYAVYILWDSRENMELKENEKIQVEWLCHMKGIGIVICLDSFTAHTTYS